MRAGVIAMIAGFAAGCGATSAPASSELPDPLAAGWRGAPVCERLQETDAQRLLRCTFPPGVGHERHFHARHLGYVIAGGRMRIEDASGVREVDIPTGYSWESDGVVWHEALNIGDTTAVYLIIEPKGRATSVRSTPRPPLGSRRP